MSIFTIQNNINFSLISLTIAPSTVLALAVLLFVYLYILHVRNNPLARPATANHYQHYGDNRGAGRPIRRPSFLRRLSGRLRTRKQRDRPVAPLWLPFSSLWLPLRYQLGRRGISLGRQIQPTRLETGRKRQSKQRLLE